MIYTITCNPAVDYYMQFSDSLTKGKVFGAEDTRLAAGGKGINCSIVLNNLGIKSTALSFLGGKTGEVIKNELKQYPLIQDEGVAVDGESRINVKVTDADGEYTLNAKGPFITPADQEKLLGKLDSLTSEDYVMLCGKSAQGVDVRFIYEVADRVSDAGAKLILDTTECRLEDLTYCEPFLIKPNLEEFSALVGKDVDLTSGSKELARVRSKGVDNVLLTLGSQGAIFQGNEGSFLIKSPAVKVVSTNGAGDCALAAFVGTYAQTQDVKKALIVSMAAGTAAVSVMGMPEKADIDSCMDRIEMEEI